MSESSPSPETGASESGASESAPTEVRIRRAPKIGVFLVLGGLVGLIASLIATSAFPVDPEVGFTATFGYLALYTVPAGVLLGAAIALPLDWASRRRARTVTAEREVTGEEPAAD